MFVQIQLRPSPSSSDKLVLVGFGIDQSKTKCSLLEVGKTTSMTTTAVCKRSLIHLPSFCLIVFACGRCEAAVHRGRFFEAQTCVQNLIQEDVVLGLQRLGGRSQSPGGHQAEGRGQTQEGRE